MDKQPPIALTHPPVKVVERSITRQPYLLMYGAVFLLSLVYAGTIYINSNYLALYFSKTWLEVLYIAGAVGTLIGLTSATNFIRRWNNFRCLITYLSSEAVILFGLATIHIPAIIGILFIFHQMLPALALFSFDIVLERAIDTERITGGVRSLYLVAMNAAFVVAPFFAGLIINAYSYQATYAVAGALMVAVVILIKTQFHKTEPKELRQTSFIESVRTFSNRRGLVEIFGSDLILESFYAIMTIFLPLYLHLFIGFNWQTIGLIIAVMLVPFVIFEAPLGKMFDYLRVEREAIMVGFFIMSISSIAIFLINSHNPIVWGALLFISRIGASFVEVGNEYSFFRRVNASDTGFISIFRMTYPFSYIIGPIALALLGPFSAHTTFGFVAIMMLFGIFIAYTLPPRPRRV